MSLQTRVTYLYRDAGNYKQWGEFVVDGKFTREAVKAYLFDNEFFLPQRVGLSGLVPKCRNEDDHELHSLEDFTSCEGMSAVASSHVMIQRFKQAATEGWFFQAFDRSIS